ncbi:MAG: META domain-containing protein [Erythrobacter sp.]|nr:MAG: META domain-containing protein [Erythrobacter sp.]
MIRTAPLLALALAAAACTTTGGGPAVDRLAMTPGQWSIRSIDGIAAADGAQLSFADGRVSATAGCNRLAGDYRIEGDRVISGPLVATRMYCEGRMEQERALSALLEGGAEMSFLGEMLTLRGTSHSLEAMRPAVGR